MQILESNGAHKVVIKQIFNAPAERIFKFWIDPDHLKQWLFPGEGVELFLAEIDAAVRGNYRLGFRSVDAEVTYVGGTYLEIIPSRKLVFSWIPEPPDIDAGKETLVTVNFKSLSGKTEVALVHENFPDKTMCDRHEAGWRGAFGQLGRVPS